MYVWVGGGGDWLGYGDPTWLMDKVIPGWKTGGTLSPPSVMKVMGQISTIIQKTNNSIHYKYGPMITDICIIFVIKWVVKHNLCVQF